MSLLPDGNQSLHEDLDVATGSRRLRSKEEELVQSSLAAGLQRSHQQALHKDVNQLQLEELQQEPELAGPEATEEPDDRVEDLVLGQTVADETPAGQPVADHLAHGRLIPDSPATGVAVALSGHMDDLLHVDHASFTNDLLVQPCVTKAEEDEEPLESRSSEMEPEREGPQGALPATARTKVAFKAEEGDAVTSGGTGAGPTEAALKGLTLKLRS